MSTSAPARQVPFFPYQSFFGTRESEFTEAIVDVLRRGAFIMQRDLFEFEEAIADYIGVKHCVGMANCTDALEIALRAAGIGPGDEVIFPSHTFVATPAAAKIIGIDVVPVECGDDHLIDPAAIEAAITAKTKAIMPVSLNGRTVKWDEIQAIADRHGLLVIEDSAQALGSKYKGKFAGSWALCGTFSFYPAKILGCFGDGGALTTNDDEIARLAKLYRDHGRDEETGDVVLWGRNSRLDTVQAAVLHLQFKEYHKIIARRREIAARYQTGLSGLNQLVLPPAPDSDVNHFDVYQNYEIEAQRRDGLKQFLKDEGIGTLVQWGGKGVHQHAALGLNVSLPKTEKLFSEMLLLPMNFFLSDEDVDYVIEKVQEFYRS